MWISAQRILIPFLLGCFAALFALRRLKLRTVHRSRALLRWVFGCRRAVRSWLWLRFRNFVFVVTIAASISAASPFGLFRTVAGTMRRRRFRRVSTTTAASAVVWATLRPRSTASRTRSTPRFTAPGGWRWARTTQCWHQFLRFFIFWRWATVTLARAWVSLRSATTWTTCNRN